MKKTLISIIIVISSCYLSEDEIRKRQAEVLFLCDKIDCSELMTGKLPQTLDQIDSNCISYGEVNFRNYKYSIFYDSYMISFNAGNGTEYTFMRKDSIWDFTD